MIKRGFLILSLVLFLLIASSSALAKEPDRILVNSEDWRDVYSVILYGNLIEKPASFLVSDKHATLILGSIDKNSHIWAISSKKVPFVVGYKSLLESKGYSVEEFSYDSANLKLAEQLQNIEKFMILDDSYGYNAISVAPYAAATKTYVIFADKDNYRDVDNFLEGRKISKLIIYGNVDREVKNALGKYNPEIINKEGDRFLNNIEIVKKYQEVKHSKQVILTNGEFIEQEIMSGAEPVLFIGTNNVPESIREYVKNSDIEIGVLIGNELVGTATFIRRQMGISVFVKFAQGARAARGAISQVEALDMYYLPVYNLNLEVESIKYNKATNNLEVTLKNTEAQAVYATGTYSVKASDGSKQTVGDIGANFIDGNEIKTFTYDIGVLPDGEVDVDIFVIYGESKGSLEKEIRKTVSAEQVRILDECQIAVSELSFNKLNKNFYVSVENIGKVDCYVDVELIDIIIAGEKTNFGMSEVTGIGVSSKKNLRVRAEAVEEDDLLDNEKIRVRVYYGERDNALVKGLESIYDLKIKTINLFIYVVAALIIVSAFILLIKRKRKKEEKQK